MEARGGMTMNKKLNELKSTSECEMATLEIAATALDEHEHREVLNFLLGYGDVVRISYANETNIIAVIETDYSDLFHILRSLLRNGWSF